MASFIRRFRFDPGVETLLEIESVNIIDLEPPATITGVGTGTAMLVGEFENGPFELATEVFGGGDFKSTFGTLGYEYDGVAGGNPSARARKADAALLAEFWNGNGFLALANKRFKRLVCVRVDTSVGEVEFLRTACVSGADTPTFDLEPGQTLDVNIGAGDVTSTFAATAGTVTSGAGTYPSTFVGGESVTLAIDTGTNQEINVVVVFTAADSLQVDVIAALNAAVGYTAFVDAGAGATSFTGRVRGTAGNVRIVAIDALVATATGFAAAAAIAGTGDVANIDQVTVAEVNTKLVADHSATTIVADRDTNGKLRICNIDPASPGTGTVTISAAAPPTATGLGFTAGQTATAVTGIAGTIPAGTRVRNGSAVEWVTMQDIAVTAASAGPYSVKVRHAVDDTTGLTTVPASVTVLPFPLQLGGFKVTNPLPLTAALTEAQIDAKYDTTYDKTVSLNSVSAEVNISFSARQSNVTRSKVRNNAITASQSGSFGRMGIIRPPIGTSRAVAKGTTVPGVGAYRDRRLIYTFPAVRTFVSQIAARGTAGGAGFTVDGNIDTPADGFMASILSQLPPEENPGQVTTFMDGVIGIVSAAGNADVQDMTIDDYKSFKASGIAAPRIDDGQPIFQSGKTSVDPLVNASLVNISRQRMSDFITDTLALRLKAFGKKLNSRSRRGAVLGEVRAFMTGLLSIENPANARIDSFSVDGISGNTPNTIALGIFRIIIKTRTLSSLDAIVIESTVGESVVVQEAA